MPWYVKALKLSQPLHFGDYGGMPLKIIWAAARPRHDRRAGERPLSLAVAAPLAARGAARRDRKRRCHRDAPAAEGGADMRVWRWPLVLGVLTVCGLVSALLGEGGMWWIFCWIVLSAAARGHRRLRLLGQAMTLWRYVFTALTTKESLQEVNASHQMHQSGPATRQTDRSCEPTYRRWFSRSSTDDRKRIAPNEHEEDDNQPVPQRHAFHSASFR